MKVSCLSTFNVTLFLVITFFSSIHICWDYFTQGKFAWLQAYDDAEDTEPAEDGDQISSEAEVEDEDS